MSVMIDFLSAEFPARLPRPILGDMVFRTTQDGELKWCVQQRRQLKGSYDASIHVRAVQCDKLEISGNPAKFLQGHNLWGPDDLPAMLERVIQRIKPVLWAEPGDDPEIDLLNGVVSRIDLTGSYEFASPHDAKAWLRAYHENGRRPYVGRGVWKGTDGSTLVYGDASGRRAMAWQLTMYLKGCEVARKGHFLPQPMMEDELVLDWVNRLVRSEVRLRTVELNRLGKRLVAAWSSEAVAEQWAAYVGKIEVMGETIDPTELDGVRARLLDAFDAWKAGRDLRAGRSRGTWYSLRRQMRELFNVDIALPPPTSNVVPLRRVIEAHPAHRPPWADAVDRRLRAQLAA